VIASPKDNNAADSSSEESFVVDIETVEIDKGEIDWLLERIQIEAEAFLKNGEVQAQSFNSTDEDELPENHMDILIEDPWMKLSAYRVGNIRFNQKEAHLVYVRVLRDGMGSLTDMFPAFWLDGHIHFFTQSLDSEQLQTLNDALLGFYKHRVNNTVRFVFIESDVEPTLFPPRLLDFEGRQYSYVPHFNYNGCIEGRSQDMYFFDEFFDNECIFPVTQGEYDEYKLYTFKPKYEYEVVVDDITGYPYPINTETGDTAAMTESCFYGCSDYSDDLYLVGSDSLVYVYKEVVGAEAESE
jgi:hypothetical protein